ncbi:Sodium/hydrogen exchanger-like domain-containing protein 1 [Myotis davidii]|uniref:Sodium/hydrogen exchanger-like domain-containing protein 1 n=1 Tax=Myotis davidii TaxID=225400 RepID=L5LTI5_MYODS|nr:Sodium/hydrogen exchanger-like domain-containing protein 1 [Myotis davidii]
MLQLQEEGYGVEKGIPTLLMAASSVDDILAITGFSIFMSMVFSTGISIACMSLALLARISATFFLVTFAGFNLKEKIFIALSWIPKATVQVRHI